MKNEHISNETSAILVGSMLGDGYLYPNTKRKRESQIQLKYCNASKPYLIWLKSKLDKDIPFNEIQKKKGCDQYYATSKPSKILGEYRDIFYPQGKKIVPSNIQSILLSSLSLAVWFMDDGSIDSRRNTYCLSTMGFSYNDNFKLQTALKNNFSLSTSVHSSSCRGKQYYRLYVPTASSALFAELIKPHIVSCFAYKLPAI